MDRSRDNCAGASTLLSACESSWVQIQLRSRGVPEVVLVLGTGVECRRPVKLGHWCDGRWTADCEVRRELLLGGEALHLRPEQVFEVLVHEAAHCLNAVRVDKDASRGGRCQNARFKAAAEELGLIVSQMPPYGWAQTESGPDARRAHDREIAAISEATCGSLAAPAGTSTSPGPRRRPGSAAKRGRGLRDRGRAQPDVRTGHVWGRTPDADGAIGAGTGTGALRAVRP